MSIQWDQSVLDAMVARWTRHVAVQAKPVIERRIGGAFTLSLETTPDGGLALVASDPRAMLMEYGDGTGPPKPWAMVGLQDAAGVVSGGH